MRLIIKLIGLAMLAGGGFMIYMAKVNQPEGSTDPGALLAILGFLIVLGWKNIWGILKAIGGRF